jgi:N-acetylneuraminic acid mutarotase
MRTIRPKSFVLVFVPLLSLGAACTSTDNEVGLVKDDAATGIEDASQLPDATINPQLPDANIPTNNTNKVYRWAQIAGPIALPPRMAGLALAYNQRIWVMGGENTLGDDTNDVWSSVDSKTWTMATADAGWSARNLLAGAVFANRMWVIDGARQGDVWSSTDGALWTMTGALPSFPPRYGHGVLAFNDKLWILGGYGKGGTQISDIWSSSDGSTWSQAVPEAPWGKRDGFASVVYNDKMWVIGGYVYDKNVSNEVWSSPDGIHWTQEPAAPFVARTSHQAAVFDGKLWMMGGSAYGGSDLNDVWSTSDGQTWIQMPASEVPWSKRSGFALAVLDQLYLIGPRTGDIWSMDATSSP